MLNLPYHYYAEILVFLIFVVIFNGSIFQIELVIFLHEIAKLFINRCFCFLLQKQKLPIKCGKYFLSATDGHSL